MTIWYIFTELGWEPEVPPKRQCLFTKVKVKCSRYRPGVAQRVGRGIALLFHDRGTRRGWVVSRTPRPHFTPGKDPVPILQEAGWTTGPVWRGGHSRPHRDSIPDRSARSQSLYRLSYPAHNNNNNNNNNNSRLYDLILTSSGYKNLDYFFQMPVGSNKCFPRIIILVVLLLLLLLIRIIMFTQALTIERCKKSSVH